MSTIVGICGSRRSGSFNMMLLRAVAAAVPHGRRSRRRRFATFRCTTETSKPALESPHLYSY
jgi:hypothetical protein